MTTKDLGLILVVTLAGCGSSRGSMNSTSLWTATTQIGAGTCAFIQGPFAVDTGTMSFVVDDSPANGDDVEIAIFSDSTAGEVVCDLATGSLVDYRKVGSGSASVGVDAGEYDLLGVCHNNTTDCLFRLSLSVSY